MAVCTTKIRSKVGRHGDVGTEAVQVRAEHMGLVDPVAALRQVSASAANAAIQKMHASFTQFLRKNCEKQERNSMQLQRMRANLLIQAPTWTVVSTGLLSDGFEYFITYTGCSKAAGNRVENSRTASCRSR